MAIVISSLKIVLTHNLPLCGAMRYMLPSRRMNQLFNYVNFNLSLNRRLSIIS